MLFTNASVFLGEEGFAPRAFRVEDGAFTALLPPDVREPGCVDLCGARVIPGLIDLHIHGAAGGDFTDGGLKGLNTMATYLARAGVTGFAPTSVSAPYEVLGRAFAAARRFAEAPPRGAARLLGVHMEGPFFSEKKKGAQNAACLRPPELGAFEALYRVAGGRLRLVDLAPELPGAAEFTRKAAERCTVSVGHTDADYDQAAAVFAAGARHLTHLFNAMPPLHHRQPGVIGAAAEREDVYAELICDGIHVHPSAVRLAFRLFPGRICLISDALRCCGMPEGEYELGGQPTFLRDGVARLSDGTIAGGATPLSVCLQKAVALGVPETEAILAATANPARQLGCFDAVGSIAPGKAADFLVCDETLRIRRVYLAGTPV